MIILILLFHNTSIFIKNICRFICLFFYINCTFAVSPSATDYSFIALADIHFNPFISCNNTNKPCELIDSLNKMPAEKWHDLLLQNDKTLISLGRDTNISLWRSTLTALQKVNNQFHPKFVVVLGDSLGHHYKKLYVKYSKDVALLGYKHFIEKTFKFILIDLKKTFPNANIYFVIGNNDSFVRNYYVDKPYFYQSLSHIFLPFSYKGSQKETLRTFETGGYYKILTEEKLKILALNTNPFSKKSKKNNAKILADSELQWLKKEINQNNQQKIIILMHIPDGVTLFFNRKYPIVRLYDFWQTDYIERYKEIISKSNNIVAVFSGHVHYAWSGMQTYNKTHDLLLFGVPSISQFYGNKSAFNVYFFTNNNDFLRTIKYKYFSNDTWYPE